MENLKIIEDLGVFGTGRRGSERRFIKAEWYGNEPIYEVREFSKDGEPLGRRGMTFDEVKKLKEILNSHDEI